MLQGILTDIVANLIVDVVHQMALCDVENLVESTRDMEPDRIHHIILHILLHFFIREPTLIGETKLQLVAIAINLLTSKDGLELRQFNLANARQVVKDLLLLGLELLLILKALPLATSTDTIMTASRFCAQR